MPECYSALEWEYILSDENNFNANTIIGQWIRKRNHHTLHAWKYVFLLSSTMNYFFITKEPRSNKHLQIMTKMYIHA